MDEATAAKRVSLVIKPQINIEVWLPMAWNERFQAVGGGGYAGSISWPAMATAIRNGYTTASTDTGHNGTTQPGGSFALNADGSLDGTFGVGTGPTTSGVPVTTHGML